MVLSLYITVARPSTRMPTVGFLQKKKYLSFSLRSKRVLVRDWSPSLEATIQSNNLNNFKEVSSLKLL